MDMKHLFVARHGYYGDDHRLDRDGVVQMELLGDAIKEILRGESAHIVSSTALRALDSAVVLASRLGLPPGNGSVEQMPYLWSGGDSPAESWYHDFSKEAPDKLLAVVNERRERAEGLVLMTHLEIAEYLPSLFYNREFGQQVRMRELSKGEAAHIDLEQRTYQMLPRVAKPRA
jgi:phosphohistidine phosphatase SixA